MATLERVGEPFKGKIWYWVEDSYGSGESTTTLPISCKVQIARIDTGDRHKVLRGIESPLACHLLKQTHEPKFHLEYIPQCDDTLLKDSVNGSSCCTLQSLAFCVGANTCLNAINSSWYYIIGCKAGTVRISASKNTEYLISIDYEVKSVTTDSADTGTEPSALTGDYLAFNIAGEITKTGGHVVDTDHIAFITNSIDLTINRKLTGYTDHDSLYKTYLIEGELDVEGTVDITLDGGGRNHIGEVLSNGSFTITLDMGGTGCPRIEIPNCEWKSGSVPVDVSGEAMMDSAPFTGKPSSCTDLISAVPAP
jgi:hypothetical protein